VRKVPYTYTIEFNTTINAGANGPAADTQIDGDSDFVVEDMAFTAWLPVAQTAIIGTPAAKEASATVGNNTFMHNAHFRLEVEQPGYKWQNNPVRVTNLIREGIQNLALTQRTIAKGTILKARLYNDASTFNVQAQLVLNGYKILPD
jgi:hypothetical protein